MKLRQSSTNFELLPDQATVDAQQGTKSHSLLVVITIPLQRRNDASSQLVHLLIAAVPHGDRFIY
jgi:hypothetical protein